MSYIITYRRGRRVRRSLKTRRIPKMRGLLSADSEMRMSTREIPTRNPSIMFQPLFRYACCPITRPLASTCRSRQHVHSYLFRGVLDICFITTYFWEIDLP